VLSYHVPGEKFQSGTRQEQAITNDRVRPPEPISFVRSKRNTVTSQEPRNESRPTSSASGWFDVDVSSVQRTSWLAIALVLALVAAFNAVVNLVVFPSEAILDGVFRPTARATLGLVRPTLLVNLVALVAFVWAVMFRGFGLEPLDVGLDRRDVARGIEITVLLWIAIQVVGAVEQLATTGTVGVAGAWTSGRAGRRIGVFLAQAFGNALFEEVLYRGFLLTQVFLLLEGRMANPRRRLATALVGSQVIFALFHLPNRLYQGFEPGAIPGNLALVFVSGVLFALVYYRTGNLFVAIGVHALGNAPLAVVADTSFAAWLTNPAMVVLILAWRPIERGLRVVEDAIGWREKFES